MTQWLTLLATNTTDHTITVAICGIRYEYFLTVHSDQAHWALRNRCRNQGQMLRWLKHHSWETRRLSPVAEGYKELPDDHSRRATQRANSLDGRTTIVR